MRRSTPQTSDTTLLRHTLNRLGHSFEDIDTVLKNHKGPISFQIAKDKLHELKNRNKYELILGEELNPFTSSAMIVISDSDSSDDEMKPYTSSAMVVVSDDELDADTHKAQPTRQNVVKQPNPQQPRMNIFTTDPIDSYPNNYGSSEVVEAAQQRYSLDVAGSFVKVNQYSDYHHNGTIAVQAYTEHSDSDVEMQENYAAYDMPKEDDFKSWFEKNYRTKFDGVVLKEDLIKHFCEDFKTPSYFELQKLFFEKIRTLLCNRKYVQVECVEDNYFDGLEKVEIEDLSLKKAQDTLKRTEIQVSSSERVTNQLQKLLKIQPNQVKSNPLDAMAPTSSTNARLRRSQPTSNRIQHVIAKSQLVTTNTQPNTSQAQPGARAAIKQEKIPVPAARKTNKVKSPELQSNTQSPTVQAASLTSQIQDLCFGKTESASKKETLRSKSHALPTNQTSKFCTLPLEDVDNVHVEETERSAHSSLSKIEHLEPTVKNGKLQTANVNVRFLSNKQLLDLPQTEGDFNLRPIVIDGSNVACSHGNGEWFSCRGIALCVRYFWLRGHRDIFCFVPNYRKAPGGNPPIKDRDILFDLEKRNICKFTPSRKVDGKMLVSYDDRYILELAVTNEGVIVSNDQYRDLMSEKQGYKQVVTTSLLQYVFAQDYFMPAQDPLGRNGPKLDDFLLFSHREIKNNVAQNHQSNVSSQLGTDNFTGRTGFNKQPKQYNFQNYSQSKIAETDHSDFTSKRNRGVIQPKQPTVAPTKETINRLREKYASKTKFTNPVMTEPHKSRQRLLEVDNAKKVAPIAKPENLKVANPTLPKHKEQPLTTEEQLKALFPDSKDKINSLIKRFPDVDDVNWFANLLLLTAD